MVLMPIRNFTRIGVDYTSELGYNLVLNEK